MATKALKGPPIAPVEAALAILGLRSVISRKVEFVTREDIKKMVNLPRTLQRLARNLVHGGLGDTYHEKLNYRQMLKELNRGWDVHQLMEMADSFPHDMRTTGAALVISASSIVKGLLADYPVSTYQTVTGSTNLLPSDSRLWKFIAKLEVLDDPTTIFPLMATAALLISQGKAVRETYPTIAAYIDWAILVETIKAKSANRDFELSPRAEVGVRAWQGNGPIDPKLLKLAQDNVARAKQRAKQAAVTPRPQDDQTLAQKSLTA